MAKKFLKSLQNEPFLTGSGSGVFNSRRLREVLRDFEDLLDGVVLGGREAVADFSGFEDTEVGVFAGELGEPGPLRSCK